MIYMSDKINQIKSAKPQDTRQRLPADMTGSLTAEELLDQIKWSSDCLISPLSGVDDWEVVEDDDLDEGHSAVESSYFRISCVSEDYEWTTLLGKFVQGRIAFTVEFVGEDYFGPQFPDSYSAVSAAVFACWSELQKDMYRNAMQAKFLADSVQWEKDHGEEIKRVVSE